MDFLFGNNRMNVHNRPIGYSEALVAYSSTLMEREDIDVGNKIILPSTVLGKLSQGQNFNSVMIFCLKNIRTGKQTFAGVLEFIADNGTCVLPKNVSSLIRFFKI